MPSSRLATSALLVLFAWFAAPAAAAGTLSTGPDDDVVARAIAAAAEEPVEDATGTADDQPAAAPASARDPVVAGQAPELQHDDDILPEETSTAGAYVRGDLGAALFATPSIRLAAPVGRFRSPSVDPTVTFGAGVGYEFGDWLRADVTLDAVPAAGLKARSFCAACAAGGFSRERADISALAALLNAYIEFAPAGVVTPYVGGGVGVSRIEATDWKYTRPDGRTGRRPDADGWNFAWALAAGVGVDVSERVVLDAGYRYLSLGSAETGRVAVGGGGGRARIKVDDVAVHQLRLGVRVRFP
jgi:opacity protein-like surface antigen